MKVLVVFSNPPNQVPLRLDKEDKVIAEHGRTFHDKVEIDRLHASDIDDIHKLIIKGSYDVIHFSGHGSKEGIYLDRSDLSETGELVSPQRVVSLLALAEKVPTVTIFLSCYSDDNIELLSNTAPFVITSKNTIADDACITFSQGFYEWLFEPEKHSVQSSFNHALSLLKTRGLSCEEFVLSRRSLIKNGNSLFLESKPKEDKDTILINLDAVRDKLDSFGIPKEILLHLLARKLIIHNWIFDRRRDSATIPIGKLLFGEFTWDNPIDAICCKNLFKLSANVPRAQWDLWSRFLTSYNDLASCEYRSLLQPALPTNRSYLEQAVKLLKLYVQKYVIPAEENLKQLGFECLFPHISFVLTQCDNAQDQLELERYPQVVEALEIALTNYHEIVDGLQPPETN